MGAGEDERDQPTEVGMTTYTDEVLAASLRTLRAYGRLINDTEAERGKWGEYGGTCLLCEASTRGLSVCVNCALYLCVGDGCLSGSGGASKEALERLVEYGADPNIPNSQIVRAARARRAWIARRFWDNGVRVRDMRAAAERVNGGKP